MTDSETLLILGDERRIDFSTLASSEMNKARLQSFLLLVSLFVVPSVVQAQPEAENCVCDCVYTRNANIKNHQYFSSDSGESCRSIQGKACIGQLRGENYRGSVENCASAASQVGAPLSPWFTIREVGSHEDISSVLTRLAPR